MGFVSKCSILNGQVIYIEKSKLDIANMWLIPLDCVTNLLLKHLECNIIGIHGRLQLLLINLEYRSIAIYRR